MKKMNNKGFSLIELIIVIAIMAVLVAVIAPNLTGYIGKSKANTDKSNADTIENVISNALQDFTTDSEMKYSTSTAVDSGTTDTIEDALTGAEMDDLNDLMALAAEDAGNNEDGTNTFLTNLYESLKKYASGENKNQINCKVTANKFWLKIEGTYDKGFTCKVKAASASGDNPFIAQ
jgi:type IV pilus assembly protein PilA